MRSYGAPEFGVSGVFGTLARADMAGAASLARGFAGESPRATALLAVALAALSK